MRLNQPYALSFTAVSDFSPFVDFQFTTTRSDRAAGTVSYDVVVMNKGLYDLLLGWK